MHHEGRHVHKNTRQPAKHIRKKQRFFGSKKNNVFSMKKLVAAAFTANIEKITVVGPQFSGKTRIFANLGVPGGTQKSWKLAAHFGQKPLKTIDPSKIVRFSIWGWLLAQFWSIGGCQKGPQETIFSYLSTYPSSSPLSPPFLPNPFKLYNFNPTQPQKEPTTPKP